MYPWVPLCAFFIRWTLISADLVTIAFILYRTTQFLLIKSGTKTIHNHMQLFNCLQQCMIWFILNKNMSLKPKVILPNSFRTAFSFMKLSVISDGGRGLGFVHDMAMVSELWKFFSKKASALIKHPLFFLIWVRMPNTYCKHAVNLISHVILDE